MVRLIIVLVVGVLALSFFGISIRAIVESPTGADNIDFVWVLIQNGWQHVVDAWQSLLDTLAAFAKPLRFPR